jgi:hypothetical protein
MEQTPQQWFIHMYLDRKKAHKHFDVQFSLRSQRNREKTTRFDPGGKEADSIWASVVGSDPSSAVAARIGAQHMW